MLSAQNIDNVFDGMPLKYFDGGTATLNDTNLSQTVYTDAASNAENGVTLGYNATHTVKLEGIKNVVTYNVVASVTTVTLGEMTWGDGAGREYGLQLCGGNGGRQRADLHESRRRDGGG